MDINSEIKVVTQKSVDGKRYKESGGKHDAWASTSEYLTATPKPLRHKGQIASIYNSSGGIDLWEFIGDIEDGNLKKRVPLNGSATLASGTVTVANTSVKTGANILVSCETPSGTQGFLSAPKASIVDATSFVINSDSAADNSTVIYLIINN